MLRDLFRLFERLLAAPGAITRTVKYIGVSRSTIYGWRDGHRNSNAENTLAVDAFVRMEVATRLGEAAEGRRPKIEVTPEPPPPPRKIERQPEIEGKDVFRT